MNNNRFIANNTENAFKWNEMCLVRFYFPLPPLRGISKGCTRCGLRQKCFVLKIYSNTKVIPMKFPASIQIYFRKFILLTILLFNL